MQSYASRITQKKIHTIRLKDENKFLYKKRKTKQEIIVRTPESGPRMG